MVGLIGQKIGMTQLFVDNGNIVPVSVIKVEKNFVVNKRILDRDGYSAVVVGSSDLSEKNITGVYRGQFKDGLEPKKYLKEFRDENIDDFKIGQEIGVSVFSEVKFVDVVGVSKGKGFQGVMKRYGFGGGRASHGSKFHREHGSTGQNTYPARCFKGGKGAGRMGREKITVQNLKVVKIDDVNNIIYVKGAIPGKNNGIVYVTQSLKKK